MGKTYPGPKDRTPSQVSFRKRSYKRKVDPFAQANSARACSGFLASHSWLGEPKCLYEVLKVSWPG